MAHVDRRLSTIQPALADQLASAPATTQRYVAANIAEFVVRATSVIEIPTAQVALSALHEQRYGDETVRAGLKKLASESRTASMNIADEGDNQTGLRLTEVHHALLTLRAALDADPERAVLASVYEAFFTDGETGKNVKARVRELTDGAS